MSEIKVPAALVSSETSFLALQLAVFSLGPRMVLPPYVSVTKPPLILRTAVILDEDPPE